MYELRRTKDFEKSYKKIQQSGKLTNKVKIDLNTVVNLLRDNKSLPAKFKDHQLHGTLQKYRECHIRHDLLLLYEIIDDKLVLVLIDMGSHSYLFK